MKKTKLELEQEKLKNLPQKPILLTNSKQQTLTCPSCKSHLVFTGKLLELPKNDQYTDEEINQSRIEVDRYNEKVKNLESNISFCYRSIDELERQIQQTD